MESILKDIFKSINIPPAHLKNFEEKLTALTLERKDFLLEPGKEVTNFYYIHNGCLRTYFIDAAGKEHTLQFAVKGWWISDYIALFGRGESKAVSYIECIKDATLLRVSKKDFDELCREVPEVSQFHISNLESAFAAFHRRILESLTLSAKERYINFISAYPDIEQSVKNYHIASFLGVTTESLSRIRKEMASE